MTSSPSVSLFTQRLDTGPQPSSFAASILVHIVAVAVISFGFLYKPPIAKVTTDYFAFRRLDLQMPDEQARAAVARAAYSSAHSGKSALSPAANPSPRPPVLREVARTKPGPQTLIQADVPNPITLPEKIPMPQVMIWSPAKTPVKEVVPPQHEKPTDAEVKPSVERPNEEMTLADVNLSSSFHPSAKPIVAASTTTPVAVHVPQQVQLPPVTASQPTAQPTPAAIVSLSDLRLKNGTAALPPVNESEVTKTQAELAPVPIENLAVPDRDIPATNAAEAGTGQGAGTKANNPDPGAGQGTMARASGPGAASVAGKSNAPQANRGSDLGLEPNGQLSATQILLPRDGHFGAVVVGNSLQDQYPEVANVWNGRVAYTVYVHVGLARSWIMQFSLPRSADAGGEVVRLDAPWPYNIVRPNLDAALIDADAIMVHGFINQSGRFETLSIVVPQSFAQAQFVLAALEKWQFRPALHDGQSAKVEVLLIIPEQFE
ncbi:MAG: hypothetical protein WCF30_04465 [Terracidiphilus sp.]